MKNMEKPSEKLYSGDYSFLERKREIVLSREGGAVFLNVPKDLEGEINSRWGAFMERQDERNLYTENGDIVCTSPRYWVNGSGVYYAIACPSEFRIFSVTRPKFKQKSLGGSPLDEMQIFRLGSASICTVEIMGSDYIVLGHELVDEKMLIHTEPSGFMKLGDLKLKWGLESKKITPRYTLERVGREKIVAPYEMEENGVMMSHGSRNVISCFDARMRAPDIESEFLMKDGRGYDKNSILLERKKPPGIRENFFLYPMENLGDYALKRGEGFDERSALLLKRYFERESR
ncbi:MAG: hypothetical protein NTY20_03690 [Candidatus Aenigmarchaeota archaeon]|nr:hypothetical protein [Candidatus Aenigmarchaeota archaeon]